MRATRPRTTSHHERHHERSCNGATPLEAELRSTCGSTRKVAGELLRVAGVGIREASLAHCGEPAEGSPVHGTPPAVPDRVSCSGRHRLPIAVAIGRSDGDLLRSRPGITRGFTRNDPSTSRPSGRAEAAAGQETARSASAMCPLDRPDGPLQPGIVGIDARLQIDRHQSGLVTVGLQVHDRRRAVPGQPDEP